MFWKRATGHGAFIGLLSGTLAAALVHGLTLAEGKGAWLGTSLYEFSSGMAQALSIAIVAWSVCFVITILVSLMTTAKNPSQLTGLVYGLTEKPLARAESWYRNPLALGLVVLAMTLILNLVFA
jgi:SSS family solute:Na+ symporter